MSDAVQVIINGKRVSLETAKISVFNRTLLFGEGLFETVLVHGGRPAFLREHFQRLWASCRALDWKVGSIEPWIRKALDAVRQSRLDRGRLRIVCVPRGIPGDLLYSEHRGYDWIFYLSVEKELSNPKALRLKTVSEDARSRWRIHKTVNYFESAHALREARQEGYDDVLFVHHNRYLLEGAFSNIFFVRKKTLYTPSLELPILNGVTRTKIIEVARVLKIRVREKKIHRDWLPFFDGCFATSSVRGIAKVGEIDRVKYPNHLPVLDSLAREYQKLLELG